MVSDRAPPPPPRYALRLLRRWPYGNARCCHAPLPILLASRPDRPRVTVGNRARGRRGTRGRVVLGLQPLLQVAARARRAHLGLRRPPRSQQPQLRRRRRGAEHVRRAEPAPAGAGAERGGAGHPRGGVHAGQGVQRGGGRGRPDAGGGGRADLFRHGPGGASGAALGPARAAWRLCAGGGGGGGGDAPTAPAPAQGGGNWRGVRGPRRGGGAPRHGLQGALAFVPAPAEMYRARPAERMRAARP
jgi:hypothetical protein